MSSGRLEQFCTNDDQFYRYGDVTLTNLRVAFDYFSQNYNTFQGDEPNEFYVRQNADWVKVAKLGSHYEKFSGKRKKKKKHE
jgi:hypothetical protein